jgi:ABC-2 type transport system ATP-binding protein
VTADDLPVPARLEDGRVVVNADRPVAPLHAITAWALERGHDLPDLEVERPSLEDVYLELTEAQR